MERLVRAALAVVVVALGGCSAEGVSPVTHVLSPVPIAAIETTGPDGVWVSDSGRFALREVAEGWVLGEYGPAGFVVEHPVDEVSMLSVHRVLELPGEPLVIVIDQTEYALGPDGWESGACYWCAMEFPEQPSVEVDGTVWVVRAPTDGSTTRESRIEVPASWDGERPLVAGAFDGSGRIVAWGHGHDGTTIVAEPVTGPTGTVCTVQGRWNVIGIDAGGTVLVADDPEGHDHGTARVAPCSG